MRGPSSWLRSSAAGPRAVEVAVDARHDLHPRRAQIALLHVGAERRRQVVGVLGDLVGETDRVLGGHAGTLRQILQHGMGGVAEQRDAPLLHSLTGSRSHSTHMRQVSMRSSMRRTSGRWSLKWAQSSPASASAFQPST